MEPGSLKRKINNQLKPIKVMLMNRKLGMSHEEWVDLVLNTQRSILDHPGQYIDKLGFENLQLAIVIDQIFEDFLKEQRRPTL